jgi:caffeoyl-CoA O-methyltransferase
MDEQLFKAVYGYIADLVAEEDEVLAAVQMAARAAGLPDISVSPAEGKLLHVLALLCSAKRILEIGTLAGYSTIWTARALPSDGRIVTIEFDPAHAGVARANFARAQLQDRISLRVGRALDVLPQLKTEGEGAFDLIFIDADKPPYAEYFQWSLECSRPGTLIIADNVIRSGAVLDANAEDDRVKGARRFNTVLSQTKEVSATILQTVGSNTQPAQVPPLARCSAAHNRVSSGRSGCGAGAVRAQDGRCARRATRRTLQGRGTGQRYRRGSRSQ